jgi:hypothetical protein
MKMKHNKKRNTAILYEILTQRFTKAVVEKNPASKIQTTQILRRFFQKGTILAKELELYKALYETRALKVELSKRLLSEVISAHSKIDPREIYKEQSSLISAMNKAFDESPFKTFIPNYKSLASIAQLFDSDTKLKSKVLLEQQIIEYISSEVEKPAADLEAIDSLVYKKFVEKFNDKYGGTLLEEQKMLVSRYISSFADNGLALKLYLNEEIGRLSSELNTLMQCEELANDKSMARQAGQVAQILKESNKRKIDAQFVEEIAKIQSLVAELAK